MRTSRIHKIPKRVRRYQRFQRNLNEIWKRRSRSNRKQRNASEFYRLRSKSERHLNYNKQSTAANRKKSSVKNVLSWNSNNEKLNFSDSSVNDFKESEKRQKLKQDV